MTGGSTLGIVVGQGGGATSTTTSYGGGGAGGSSSSALGYGGAGGGYSGIFSSTTINQTNARIIAGGGGGGSPGASAYNSSTGDGVGAGGGGGTSGGQDAIPSISGRGGTQSAGGAKATGTSGCSVAPAAGSTLTGGRGGTANGGSAEGGGGGGGGYYGGGGGLCQSSTTENGDGGGGSGFLHGTAITGGSMTAGNSVFADGVSSCSGTANSGGASNPLYTPGIGQGTCFANGGNGEIVLQYHAPTITMSVISNGAISTYTFTGTNGYTGDSITTTTAGTAKAGATIALTAGATATTVTVSVPAGYTFPNAVCTGMGAGTMTPTYVTTPSTSTTTGTLAFNTTATAAANDIACTVTLNLMPTFKLQVSSLGATGNFGPSGQTNLASAPGPVNITATNTPTPSSPTAISVTAVSTAITLTIPPPPPPTPVLWAMTAVNCTDANGTVTGNSGTFGTYSGQVMTVPAANVLYGADITCLVTEVKASVSFQVVSLGGTGTFSFSGSANLASTPGSITTGASNTAAPASPTVINVTNVGTAVTLTQSVTTGYTVTGFVCTDASAAATGNTGTFFSYASQTFTISATSIKAGIYLTCTIYDTKTPTVTLQQISLNATAVFNYASSTNLAATPASITTSGMGTAYPASPTAIAVSTIGTAVTITKSASTVWTSTGFTCTDSNAAVTGNSGSFGSGTYNAGTIPSGNIVAGAVINCIFTDNLLPTLTLTMKSNGGVAGFTFTGTNGWSTQTITTATPGTGVAGALQRFTTASTATTLTQAIPAGYLYSSVSCTGMGSGTATPNYGTGDIAFDANALAPGNTITCTVTDIKLPTLQIAAVSQGSTTSWTYTGTNGWSSAALSSSSNVTTYSAVQTLTAASTATSVTQSAIYPGSYLNTPVCTGLGSGGSVSFATDTITLDALATAPGAVILCTFTNTWRAVVKTQVITVAGAGGPFAFGVANMDAAPAAIATTANNTATPGSPTSIYATSLNTAVSLTQATPAGYTLTSASCSDSNYANSGNGSGSIGTLSGSQLTVPSTNVLPGAYLYCVFTNTKLPSLTLTMVSNGGTTGFTFTGGNGWSSQTITPATIGVGATGAMQTFAAASTATTITQTIPPGYAFSSVSCSGMGSGTVTPTYSSGALAFNALATAPGNAIACTVTDDKMATISLQVVSWGGTNSFGFGSGTNVATTLGSIPTVTEGVAAPASIVRVNVLALATDITFNQTPPSGYAPVGFTCTDGNAAVTNNSGTFGTFSSNSFSVAASHVKAGADINCISTDTRPRVKLQKITLGGSGGAFTFSQSNLAATPASITTTAASTATPSSPGAINVTTVGNAVSITEAALGGWFISAGSCTDANSTITGNSGALGTLSGNTLTLSSATVKPGADFTCIITDTKGVPGLTLAKTVSPTGPVPAGATLTYTYRITNTGNVPLTNITVSDSHNGTGIFTGPFGETLTTNASGGASSDAIANDGYWSVLAPGDMVSFTATYVVSQHDVDYLQ